MSTTIESKITYEVTPQRLEPSGVVAPDYEGVEHMANSSPQATPQHRRLIAIPKHPGIYRKGSRYHARWRHHGRQRARSFRTLSEAARFRKQVTAGDTKVGSREPFDRYARSWISTYSGRTSRGISDATRTSYEDALTRHAIPHFRSLPLDQIDPPRLRQYISHLDAKGLAPASVRRAYAPLRALLATAAEDGMLRTNPSVRIVLADRRGWRPKSLTADQTRQLLTEIPAEHADLVYVLASTGMRISEALAARWGDVGPDVTGRPSLRIPKAKTPSGVRRLALTPETTRKLTRRRAESRNPTAQAPVFATVTGRHMDAHNFRQRVFNPARRRAGLDWATPHMLRHGLATLMSERGYSPAQIAAQLGHADGGVLALRTYIHAVPLTEVTFVDEALADR